MARQIVDGLSAKGQNPQAQGPSGAQPPEMAQQVLGQRMAELQGADPQMGMKKLNQMKQDVVQLIPQYAFRVPGMSKHLSALLKALDGALKEMETASSTQGAVSKLGSSMASNNEPGMPGPGMGVGTIGGLGQ